MNGLPVGVDYPIAQKIAWAGELFDAYGEKLLSDRSIVALLHQYRHCVNRTWTVMDGVGIAAQCTDCAVNHGGSCCGLGIEDRFDVLLLLVNRLLGCEVPSAPLDPQGCWFLGGGGCRLLARHVICINYLCRRLSDGLDPDGLRRMHQAMVAETDLAFTLEEAVKRWLAKEMG